MVPPSGSDTIRINTRGVLQVGKNKANRKDITIPMVGAQVDQQGYGVDIITIPIQTISADYQNSNEQQSNTDTCVSYMVTAVELNVRDKPEKPSKILTTAKQDDIVCVYSFVGKWGKTDRGWISRKYLKSTQIDKHEHIAGSTEPKTASEINYSKTQEDKPQDDTPLWIKSLSLVIFIVLLFLLTKYWKVGIRLILIGAAFALHPLFGFIALLLVLAHYFSCNGEKCPKCKTCIKKYSTRELIHQHYKHATKTGDADKRYSDNPLYSTYLDTYKCSNEECNQVFQIEKTEES